MNKLIYLTITVLVIAVIVLQGANIYIANSKTTDGISAGELTQELVRIQEENAIIEAKVLELSSFRNVASKAAEFGFEAKKDFVSLYDPVEVAVSQ